MRWTYLPLFAILTLIVHVAGLPAPPIKTKQLRAHNARIKAIAVHILSHPGYTPTRKDHADHLIELQQVTSVLNKDNFKPTPTCFEELKVVLNDDENLAIVPSAVNMKKGNIVNTRLSKGIQPGKSFTPGAVQHIQDHRVKMTNVAQRVDSTLVGPKCNFHPATPNPISTQMREIYGIKP